MLYAKPGNGKTRKHHGSKTKQADFSRKKEDLRIPRFYLVLHAWQAVQSAAKVATESDNSKYIFVPNFIGSPVFHSPIPDYPNGLRFKTFKLYVMSYIKVTLRLIRSTF